MPVDMNDAGIQGVSLGDLVDAARNADPISVEGEAAAGRLADEGIRQLRESVVVIQTAQDAAARGDELARLMSTRTIEALGAAWNHRGDQFQASLFMLQAIRGLGVSVRGFLHQVKAAAKAQIDNKTIAKRKPSKLDRLTKDIQIQSLVEPDGYKVDDDGVWREQLAGNGDMIQTLLAPAPFLIIGRSRDVHDGTTLLTLAWCRRGIWTQRIVPRVDVLDARSLIRLAQYDAPVDSTSCGKLVEYLSKFEAANIKRLEHTATTPHMGWSLGSFIIGPDAYGDPVSLASSGGLEGIAAGWSAKGTWEGWCDVVRDHLLERPSALLGIYASACAPLLKVLNQSGFAMDWSGETSLGKTSTLRCAASVWGLPDDRDGGIILSWASASTVGPIAVAAFLQSLPVILDDTKRAARPEIVASMAYDIPAGQERLRGKVDGNLQQIKRWRTVLLSTGEAPITSFSQDAGGRARCLCLKGSPFGGDSPENRKASEDVAARLMDHYGHAGRRLVQYIIGTEREKLVARFNDLRTHYANMAETAVAGRMASYVAVLDLTADLLHQLGMPVPEKDPVDLAWEAVVKGSQEADRAASALVGVHAWAAGNQARFWKRQDYDGRGNMRIPSNGFAGRWDTGSQDPLCFDETVLEQVLRTMGHQPSEIISAWHRRGWLDSPSGRRKKKCRVNGENIRLVAIRAHIIDTLASD